MRIVAGECQFESYEQSLVVASHCQRICGKYGFEYYYKASFDKANRSSANSKRGVGLKDTLNGFWALKQEMPGLKILTDVHEVEHIRTIKDEVDVLQIPAFLCRQTDLVVAACETDKVVNIKKGQFLAPWDMKGILSKTSGAKEVWITERGTSFGYNTLVNDFTGMKYLLDTFDVPVVFDATHSVQKPGGNGDTSGGNREYVKPLAMAAAAIGVTDFFFEVHPNPEVAPSDGPNSLYLEDFESVVSSVKNIINATITNYITS